LIPSTAAALGANIIEKHFTLDKNMEGPDHRASLEPDELKQMVDNIRNIEAALGNGIKKFNKSELDTMHAARKSIVAARIIKKGQKIERKDIDFKRPGTGLSPAYYKDIIGKTAMVDIDIDQQISFSVVE
jgi:sialic acid synthase SpsE